MKLRARYRIRNSAALQEKYTKRTCGFEQSQARIIIFSAFLSAIAAIAAAALGAWVVINHDRNKDAERSADLVVEALIDIQACAVGYVRDPRKWLSESGSNKPQIRPPRPQEQTEVCDRAPLKKAQAVAAYFPKGRQRQIISKLCADAYQEILTIAITHLESIRSKEIDLQQKKKLVEAFRSAEFVMANAQLGYQAFLNGVQLIGERCGGVPSTIPSQEFDRLRSAYIEKAAFIAEMEAADPKNAPNEDKTPGRLSSSFGYRRDPITGRQILHPGNDFVAKLGTPVFAVESGRVNVYQDSNYGIVVSITKSPNDSVLYAHLSKALVRDGDFIRVGDKIGAVGATGRATGPHLHIEKRVRDIPVDPSSYTAKQIFSPGTGR